MPLLRFFRRSWRDGVGIYWTLFKISFPLLCAVKVLDDAFGIIAVLGGWLSPLMGAVGLPGGAGIVFAAAMLLNVYAALLLTAALWAQLDLSTAQATVLMTMVLVAHALPVELRIVQQAGMRAGACLLLRVGGAFLLGALLCWIYGDTWLQEPAHLALSPPPPAAGGWGSWLANEARNWALIFGVVQALVLFVNFLKESRLEMKIAARLAPVFSRIGIGEQATTMAMVGLFLGLSYGGGLLIKESRGGRVGRRDALCALTMLSLCHSVVEDTLLVMLVGAHWSGVLVGRVVFSLVFMLLFARVARRLSDSALDKIAPPRAAAG